MCSEQINENWKAINRYLENKDIKHFSFDFWNTIAYSNPEFKNKRAELVLGFIKNKFSVLAVNTAFAKVGAEYNSHQESGMELLSPLDLLNKILKELTPSVRYCDLYDLKVAIDSLFLEYPPELDNNLYAFFERIQYYDKVCSITSNTAFISGDVIKQFLTDVKLLDKFSFCLFSNEVGYGKPSSNMYQLLYRKAKAINPLLRKSQIIHIGDNELADYKGALRFGLKSFHIKFKQYYLNEKYAVHSINDTAIIPFNKEEYSKFKFGDSHIAQKYGIELFEYFRNSLLPELIVKHNNFLIYSSPYVQIPTSSYYMTQAFYSAFSDHLKNIQLKNSTVKICKIKRCQTYTEDYGALSAEARFNLIKNDTYEFVDIPTLGDVCIFIDDISITGTHQRVIENLLYDGLIETSSIFLYYAKLNNPEICPSFENELNYSFIADIINLTELILSDAYKITTRTTKKILSLPTKDLEYLLGKINQHEKYSILNELVEMSHANEYNNIELYMQNLKTLKQYVLELNT
jgi:FMN phosphatase YigB (HAD superfamily)